MSKTRRSRVSKTKRATFFERRDYRRVSEDVSAYGSLNIETGEYYSCESMSHACRHTCGQNRKNQNRNWIACVRGDGYFWMW